jgi:hypothetical protein
MSPELAGTEYVIVPVVMPDDPEVIAIHGTSASAVQPHAEVVVMVAVNVPPPLGTGCTVGDSTYEHEELGVTGDELCPQPTINASSNMPTPYRIFMADLHGHLEQCMYRPGSAMFHETHSAEPDPRLMDELFMASYQAGPFDRRFT